MPEEKLIPTSLAPPPGLSNGSRSRIDLEGSPIVIINSEEFHIKESPIGSPIPKIEEFPINSHRYPIDSSDKHSINSDKHSIDVCSIFWVRVSYILSNVVLHMVSILCMVILDVMISQGIFDVLVTTIFHVVGVAYSNLDVILIGVGVTIIGMGVIRLYEMGATIFIENVLNRMGVVFPGAEGFHYREEAEEAAFHDDEGFHYREEAEEAAFHDDEGFHYREEAEEAAFHDDEGFHYREEAEEAAFHDDEGFHYREEAEEAAFHDDEGFHYREEAEEAAFHDDEGFHYREEAEEAAFHDDEGFHYREEAEEAAFHDDEGFHYREEAEEAVEAEEAEEAEEADEAGEEFHEAGFHDADGMDVNEVHVDANLNRMSMAVFCLRLIRRLHIRFRRERSHRRSRTPFEEQSSQLYNDAMVVYLYLPPPHNHTRHLDPYCMVCSVLEKNLAFGRQEMVVAHNHVFKAPVSQTSNTIVVNVRAHEQEPLFDNRENNCIAFNKAYGEE